MDLRLLATQLRIPPQPQHVLYRARLIDVLESSIVANKLIELSAPAGYGKTTLLVQWAHATRFPVAWLSLSQQDNEIERFLRALFMAWETIEPDLRQSSLCMLLGSIQPEWDAVLSAFINSANDRASQIVFVLDDYHFISDQSIHQALTFLLDHLPPTLHFVISGRSQPALPLARYRARAQLFSLGTEQLQFLQQETVDFLTSLMHLDLSHHEVAMIHAQLEGWIAGLQLVALSMQRRDRTAGKLLISGSHRFIADYLKEDVLAHQPPEVQRFLLETSILERMTGALCNAVTGKKGGQEMLETLERENLFLVPLDDNREWYRYHRLFADYLQQALQRHHPALVVDLHRQAARWFLAHRLPEEALQHAIAGHDGELVVEIGEHFFEAKLLGGEYKVLKRLLDSLPSEWHSSYPLIGFFQVGIYLFTGALEAGARCIDEIEERLILSKREDKRWQLARVTALRCTLACFQNDLAQAEIYARAAQEDLLKEDHAFRATLSHALGDTYRRNGRWKEARACYLKTLDLVHDPAYRIRSVHVFGALADLALRQGHLRSAALSWKKALSVIEDSESWGNVPLPLIGWVYIRMAEILYEQNELGQARDQLSSGLARAELGGDVQAMIAGYLLASRAKLTEGDIQAAAEYLERARPMVEGTAFSVWSSRFQRCQLELFLAQDKIRAAVHWVDEILQEGELWDQPEREAAQLAMAHVLIVKGGGPALERARMLLERLLRRAEAQGRMGIEIEAHSLTALCALRSGEHASAMIALERALRLAEPEGYIRVFVDRGQPLIQLLQQARSRSVLTDYIERLLAASGTDLARTATWRAVLVESLTPREQEILELLAAGLTNREVARKLVISPETVKKHTGTIYSKLDVSNRTQAVARARALGLLH